MEDIKYPNLLIRIYICLFKEREKWKIARAASVLKAHSFNTWAYHDLYEVLDPIETELWKEIYKDYQ